jgi:hypothetical protein
MKKNHYAFITGCLVILTWGGIASCGSSKPTDISKFAPQAPFSKPGSNPIGLKEEHNFLKKAMGDDLADLSLCGELQARLQALYWELMQGPNGGFLSDGINFESKSQLIRESGILEGQLLDVADRCSASYTNVMASANVKSTSLVEVPAIFKFLSNLVNLASDSETKLKNFYEKLGPEEKEALFQAIRSGHARYDDKIDVFGRTGDEFGVNLATGRLRNEAIAILKIANTGDNVNGGGFSKVFWDGAQENKQLPIDLSLKVGSSMIRDGADVLVEVATGSALGDFGTGVGKAKEIIEKIDKADTFLSKAYSEIKLFYDNRIRGLFNGGNRAKDLIYSDQEYIDFHGNISISPNGIVQVKNHRNLNVSDLRAKVLFTNVTEADSVVLIHEFRDGRRSVQVLTQAGGGNMISERYVPASEQLSENGTTILVVKRDPLTANVKYTATSARFAAGETATLTLDIPDVGQGGTDNINNPDAPNSGQTMCTFTIKSTTRRVCLDFAGGSGTDPAASAKSFCDGAQSQNIYESVTHASRCPSGPPIKTCPSSIYTATFYSEDSSQANNISCDTLGQWVWGG